jgi:hypothetical protein
VLVSLAARLQLIHLTSLVARLSRVRGVKNQGFVNVAVKVLNPTYSVAHPPKVNTSEVGLRKASGEDVTDYLFLHVFGIKVSGEGGGPHVKLGKIHLEVESGKAADLIRHSCRSRRPADPSARSCGEQRAKRAAQRVALECE